MAATFGRRAGPPPPQEPDGIGKPVLATPSWQASHGDVGDITLQTLVQQLLAALAQGGSHVHAETLMAAVGALAGFAAQHAALARADEQRRAGRDPHKGGLALISGTRSGARYLFGDDINEFLFERPDAHTPVGYVIGAGLVAGVAREQMPNLRDFTGHVARVVGTPDFGKLLVPERHQPREQILVLLGLWPLARAVLVQPAAHVPEGQGLPERDWARALGLVGTQCMTMVKDVLPPGLAATIFVQSALFAAKVDPDTFDAGRWQLAPSNGLLYVTRLAA